MGCNEHSLIYTRSILSAHWSGQGNWHGGSQPKWTLVINSSDSLSHTRAGDWRDTAMDVENGEGRGGKWRNHSYVDTRRRWKSKCRRAGWCWDSEKQNLSLNKWTPYSCHGDEKSGDEPAQNNVQGRQSFWRHGRLWGLRFPHIPPAAPCSARWRWLREPKWTETNLVLRISQQASDNWRHFKLLWNWSWKSLPSHKSRARGADWWPQGKKGNNTNPLFR